MQKARRQTGTIRRWTIVLRPLVGIQFHVLFHSPNRGSFHLSLTLLCTIGDQEVFSLTGWSPWIHARFHETGATRDDDQRHSIFVYRIVTFYDRTFQTVQLIEYFVTLSCLNSDTCRSHNTDGTTAVTLHDIGLGCTHFARRYYGYRGFFLFPGLLRCFSSPRSLQLAMDSPAADRG